jgi:hypothetical protein
VTAAVRAVAAALLAAAADAAHGHEMRPAYLEINELAPGRVQVLFKQPVAGEYALPLRVAVPTAWREVAAEKLQRSPGAVVRETIWDPAGALAGQRIAIDGLAASLTDALVKVSLLDGTRISRVIKPAAPFVELPSPGSSSVSGYLVLGIEHILRGVDHLLFVLGLLVIVGRRWLLMLKTITAFTVAHSLTLGAATLGWVRVPAAPLNAAIALSILFLGVEIARQRRGRASVTTEHPWVAAFGFGLLHGLGFASGLSTLGLTTREIVGALLLFNIGVEVGQLAFVGIYLALQRALRALQVPQPRWAEALPAYVVGTLGAYWTIVQTLRLVGGGA